MFGLSPAVLGFRGRQQQW